MASLRELAANGVKVAAGGLDRLVPPWPGVPVLLYHRVGGGSGRAVDMPPDLFSKQMEFLAARCHPVSLDEALGLLAGDRPGPDDSVVVTFDDGTADFADTALPVLHHHQIPATVFLATAFVDEGKEFPDGATPLTWSALTDAVATGLVTVGSHTHDHLLLDRVDPLTAAEQLDRSIGLIGEHLGVEAAHFAYPKALSAAPPVQREIRERFRSASVAGTRSNRYGATDPFRLSRSPVQTADGMHWFAHKVAGGMALEDWLRQRVVGRRYRGRVT